MKKIAAICLLAFSLCGAAFAQTEAAPATAQPAPVKPNISAAAILDKFIEATGGKAAYARLKSTYMKGSLVITAQNIKGTLEMYARYPNKTYMIQDIQQVGKSTVGFDGKTGWSKDPMQGLRTLSGKELAQLKDQAVFNGPLHWREMYPKVELIGIRQVEGKDAYAVRLTPKIGKPTIQFHDKNTFLIVRSDSVQESPQGSIPVETYVSDYRDVDGVKIPFKIRSRLAAAEIVTEFTEVKNNVPVPDTLFVKPKN